MPHGIEWNCSRVTGRRATPPKLVVVDRASSAQGTGLRCALGHQATRPRRRGGSSGQEPGLVGHQTPRGPGRQTRGDPIDSGGGRRGAQFPMAAIRAAGSARRVFAAGRWPAHVVAARVGGDPPSWDRDRARRGRTVRGRLAGLEAHRRERPAALHQHRRAPAGRADGRSAPAPPTRPVTPVGSAAHAASVPHRPLCARSPRTARSSRWSRATALPPDITRRPRPPASLRGTRAPGRTVDDGGTIA